MANKISEIMESAIPLSPSGYATYSRNKYIFGENIDWTSFSGFCTGIHL